MHRRKALGTLLLCAVLFLGPVTAVAAPNPVTGLDRSIYETTDDNVFYFTGEKVVRWVGGFGGLGFTLAVLIISLFIIFGSISSAKIGRWWGALLSCVAGAFIFYSAYFFAPAIASIAFN